MLLQIDGNATRPMYMQIIDEVRRLVVIGDLTPEQALPSVRQLAADLRINHNTIAQAYRELEREGVVYTRRGQGTFVAPRIDRGLEKQLLLEEVARRAIGDARRHGIVWNELVDAIASLSASGEPVARKENAS